MPGTRGRPTSERALPERQGNPDGPGLLAGGDARVGRAVNLTSVKVEEGDMEEVVLQPRGGGGLGRPDRERGGRAGPALRMLYLLGRSFVRICSDPVAN